MTDIVDKVKAMIKTLRKKKRNAEGPEDLEIFDDSADRVEYDMERKGIAPEEISLSDIASAITKRDVGRKL